jgi:putative rhamnosyltransferase
MKDVDGESLTGPASAPTPLMLITTRFGIGVRDLAWLDHRVTLISSITAPSLLAQDDRRFYWAIFTDPDLPPEVHGALEETLAPFEGRAFLVPGGRYGTGSSLALAQELDIVGADEYVLTARIDDDDAWNRQVVGMVRQRAGEWIREQPKALGLGITFQDGLEWLMYDMVDVDALQKGREVRRKAAIRPYIFPFLATSVFILSKLSDRVTALSASHSRMETWLAEKGYDVDIIATERPMWLYCRHKQAESGLQKSTNQDVEMTVADLAMEFGLDEARTIRYLANADDYGYGISKRLLKQRGELQKKLKAVNRQVRDPAVSDSEKVQLRLKEAKLAAEIEQVGSHVVGTAELSSAGN